MRCEDLTSDNPNVCFKQTFNMSTSLDKQQNATRQRILDAAMELYGRNGIQATSLRTITRKAEVNLASVNYHFGSKDKLTAELIISLVKPINDRRYELLKQFEENAAPAAVPVEKVLEALYRPCFEYFGRDDSSRCRLQLLGRSMYETGHFTEILAEREWLPLVKRFHNAMRSSMPKKPSEDILWHFHFSVGAMIHAVSQYELLCSLCSGIHKMKYDSETVIRMLIAHNAAGFASQWHPEK